MMIIEKKHKIEDYQLRELEIGILLIDPETLDTMYLYEHPTKEYITLDKWESKYHCILKDG